MKRVYTLFSFLLIAIFLHGQYDPKENFYDAEFFFAEEDYAEALYAFNQVYNDGYEDNANINYRIGVCLLELEGRKTEAIPYLETAIKNITEKYREGSFREDAAPPDAYLFLGNAYRIDEQFDKACENYKKFLTYAEEETPQYIYTNIQIDACQRAKEALKSEADYAIGTLGQINAIRAPVYNPVISGDLGTFAFMGRQKFYNGIYVSRQENGKWTKPYNITPSIQSDGNQTVIALSHDGQQMLVTWADQFESDIWITEYRNDRWYKSEPIGKPINSRYYESHACFTPDGNTIYFTSNRRESVGGMDIFKSERTEEGWSDIILLGEHINTPLNEDNPYVSPDGSRLYFSSQGHPGLGGFDIFYVTINEDGSYSAPVHLEYPLNTTDDDFAFIPKEVDMEDALTMYSKGEADQVEVFRFEWIPESAQPVAVAFETALPKKEEAEEEMLAEEVKEEVTETVEEAAEEAAEEVVEEEVVEEVKEEVIEEMAEETYMIRPVFFGFDSYALGNEGKEKLNGLASIMKRFPNIELEVVGHTDSMGPDAYNDRLAKQRADAVAEYLVAQGINADRLTTTSRGEKKPAARNTTPDGRDAPKGRELNRRVHFNVSVQGGVLIEIQDIAVPDHLKLK